MVKKIFKYGNSLAILIDKPILELLNLNENTQFIIRIEGDSIILNPVRKESPIQISKDVKLQKLYEEIIEKYGTILKKLANS